ELTAVSQVPGLTSNFMFQQKQVVHLWKVLLNCINSGTETLIGDGPHSTLIKESIAFEFPNDTEILNSEVVRSDLPLAVEQKKPYEITLKFSQWRPGEQASFSLFITSKNVQTSPLLPRTTTRDIVDGKILIKSSLIIPVTQKNIDAYTSSMDRYYYK